MELGFLTLLQMSICIHAPMCFHYYRPYDIQAPFWYEYLAQADQTTEVTQFSTCGINSCRFI